MASIPIEYGDKLDHRTGNPLTSQATRFTNPGWSVRLRSTVCIGCNLRSLAMVVMGKGCLLKPLLIGLCWALDPTAGCAQQPAVDKAILANMLELPSSRSAQSVLQTPTRVFWERTPLRSGLQELSRQHACTIWLDRDIDPNQLVTTRAAAADQDSSLGGRIAYIAALVGAEAGLIENVVYIGPSGRVAKLQRAAIELHNSLSQITVPQPASSLQPARMRELAWPELATANDLLATIESTWQVEFDQRLPHDLFHAGKFLQPATLATQATVILGGFEREAEWLEDNRLRIIPLQARMQWQASYAKRDVDLRSLVGLIDKYAGGQCHTRGNVCLINGVTNFHLALLTPPRAAARPDVSLGSNSLRYEFQVANTPVAVVLESLSQSIGFELQWDKSCTDEQRGQLVSFAVKQVTLDQLLAEVARSSSLRIERRKSMVTVSLLDQP